MGAACKRESFNRWAAVTVLATAACWTSCDSGPDRPDGVYAEFHTSKGLFVARLEPDKTPLAVANFVGLAEGTIENEAFDPGRPFYDGVEFHRVVPGHVIQAGIPASDRSNGPGYSYPNEIHADLSHDHAGALGVANSGRHTNASQWYVTLGDRSYLDDDYIVFGDVVEGMDVVMSVVQGDMVDSIRIRRYGRQARGYHPDSESFRDMLAAAQQRVRDLEAQRREAERAWLASRWPDAVIDTAAFTVVASEGGTGTPAQGSRRVRYTGTVLRYVGHLLGRAGPALEPFTFSSMNSGDPTFGDEPSVFPFVPGSTILPPALNAVITDMSAGERRTVIAPSAAGYGRRGFYGPDVPGSPRFVISPYTMLVYDVEVLDGDTPSD